MIIVDHVKLTKQIVTLNTSSAIAVDEHILKLFKAADDSSALEYNLNDFYYEIGEKLRKYKSRK